MGVRYGKRGIFFSIDAFVALLIVLAILLVAFPIIHQDRQQTNLHYDVLSTLSAIEIQDLPGLPAHLSSEIRANNTVLEQIGEFYVTNVSAAQELAEIALNQVDTRENIGIWFANTLVWSKNNSAYDPAQNDFISIARQTISGIQNGTNITGFSARAFLTSTKNSKYSYFGGYVGDGNVTVGVEYAGNITDAEMELVINKDFDLYINDDYVGTYGGSTNEFTPVTYSVPITNFSSGNNTVTFVGDGLHVAGGFLKITYESEVEYEQEDRYYFPGIEGLINLYDGFFLPENTSSMSLSLHLNTSDVNAFLNIGNTTVYNSTTSGEETVVLDNAQLSSLLDYDELGGKTTPLRFGLENITFTQVSQTIDIFSVTDLSGSMACSVSGPSCTSSQAICEGTCGGVWQGPIDSAKQANDLLIDAIINITGSRVGLAGYSDTAPDSDYHELSTDNESLKNEVATWSASGGTCICCGINKAITGLVGERYEAAEPRQIFYYDFETSGSSVVDSASGENNATINGDASFVVDTLNGSAMTFDGDGDYLEISADPRLEPRGENLTFATWFKSPDSTVGSTFQTLFMRGNAAGGEEFSVKILEFHPNGFIKVTVGGLTTSAFVTPNIRDQQWHHIAVTFDSDGLFSHEIHIYVDGSLEHTESFGPSQFDSDFDGSHAWVGTTAASLNSNFGEWLNGTLDEVRFYDRELSLSEIQALADQTPSCGNGAGEVGEVCDGDTQACLVDGFFEGTHTCNSQCNGFSACTTETTCGDGYYGPGEECDDGNAVDGDGCSSLCQLEDSVLTMAVMSDGSANDHCPEQPGTNATTDAISAACDAWDTYGIQVHAIAFGDDADTNTLQQIAQCGQGEFYFSAIDELVDVYENFTNAIITEYIDQAINATSNLYTRLYHDSYIEFSYPQQADPSGLILTAEAPFDDDVSGTFSVPADAVVLETGVTSYSGPRWTDNVTINLESAYLLSDYGSEYLSLGDPYIVNIPPEKVGLQNNITLTTGTAPGNSSDGSLFNSIIYTIARNASSFSDISITAQGCTWHIQFEDDSNITVAIPADYTGSDDCYYAENNYFPGITGPFISNPDDALQSAVLFLLEQLDLNNNDKVDVILAEQDLQINVTEVTGIPFAYSTEVQARVWG